MGNQTTAILTFFGPSILRRSAGVFVRGFGEKGVSRSQTLGFNGSIAGKEGHMTGRSKAIGFPIALAAIISLSTNPAYAQSSFKKGRGAPAAESRPAVDEKAYKAALDRIPTPKQGYDPWGQVRPPDAAKTTAKPN
jgi:hypothetical protein